MERFMRNKLAHQVALCLMGSVATLASAQEQEQDVREIVVSASGIQQRIIDAPASISVVSAVELEQRPYITLIDAVRDLEGVDVGETSDKTGQRTISMRGMGSDYTLILIDGRRQNNHGDVYPNAFGGNQFNHIPPLDTIERIEVIRGPASTLYGADALGGVINIITKRVSDHWGGSFTVGHSFQQEKVFGEDTTYDFSAQGPLIPGVLGLSVRGARYERDASQPEYEAVADPDGVVHERALGFGSGGRTVNNINETLGGTLTWTISPRQNLMFEYDISRQEYDNSPSMNNLGTLVYPLGTVDNIDSIWAERPRAGYSADQRFTRDQWSVSHDGQWGFGNSLVTLAYIDTANHGRTMPFSVAERELHTQIFEGEGAYQGLSEAERRDIMEKTFLPRARRDMISEQYTLDAKLDIPIEGFGGSHHLVVGGQYIDGTLDDGVFGMEAGGTGEGIVQDHEMYAVFLEDNWSPFDALTITAGVRFDDHNIFGGHVSPRLYGVYTVSENWTVKGGVSTGYKTPKTTDLFDGVRGFGSQGTSPMFGNPDLEPEESVNQEVGVYWQASSAGHSFNVTYFLNDFKDKISRGDLAQDCALTGGVRPCVNIGAWAGLMNMSEARQSVNIDEAQVQGVEVVGRYRVMDGLSLRANYTWTDSEQKSGPQQGQPLTDTAEHMGNVTMDWTVLPSLSMQLTSEIRSERYRGLDSQNDFLYYKGYNVWHLGAQYHITPAITLSARVNNLLDKDFTSFDSNFVFDEALGEWSLDSQDHYNNKDKARSFWLSIAARF